MIYRIQKTCKSTLLEYPNFTRLPPLQTPGMPPAESVRCHRGHIFFVPLAGAPRQGTNCFSLQSSHSIPAHAKPTGSSACTSARLGPTLPSSCQLNQLLDLFNFLTIFFSLPSQCSARPRPRESLVHQPLPAASQLPEHQASDSTPVTTTSSLRFLSPAVRQRRQIKGARLDQLAAPANPRLQRATIPPFHPPWLRWLTSLPSLLRPRAAFLGRNGRVFPSRRLASRQH